MKGEGRTGREACPTSVGAECLHDIHPRGAQRGQQAAATQPPPRSLRPQSQHTRDQMPRVTENASTP